MEALSLRVGVLVPERLRPQHSARFLTYRATGHGAHGLELGADDYLVKPFSRIALMAHVKAVLRRAQLPPPVEALPDFVAGDLTMHFQDHQVTLRGEPVLLTPMEYKLLYHLVRTKMSFPQQKTQRVGEAASTRDCSAPTI